MACQEIDLMRRQVCDSLRGNVTSWQWNLQSRYGDPRVYAMQQQQMAQQEAAFAHDMSRRSSAQFQDTYETRSHQIRSNHSKRISAAIKSDSKTRGRKGSATRPQSEAVPARSEPPPPESSAPTS